MSFKTGASIYRIILLLALFLMIGSDAAQGYVPSSASYARLSEDGQRLLVMTTGDPRCENPLSKPFELPDGRRVILHEKFKQSGVYDATTLTPLWKIATYCYEENLQTTPDMENMAIVNDHSFETGHPFGLSFYHRGIATRSYSPDELLKHLRATVFFRFTTANYHLDWYETFELVGGELHFQTASRTLGTQSHQLNLGLQDSYVFNMRTGEIIHQSTTGVARFILLAILLPSGLLTSLTLWIVKRRAAIRETGTI